MGFLSKAWKGLKNGVKKIGKGIKSAVKSVGKFMDKIGIVGQIALMFVLPGIGAALGSAWTGAAGALSASSNALMAGVGKVMTVAGKFAATAGNVFKTVTDGIGSFIKNVGGGMVNKIGSKLGFEKLIASAPDSMSKGFTKWMEGVSHDVANITSPFRQAATEVASGVESAFDKGIEYPYEEDLMGLPADPGTEFGRPGDVFEPLRRSTPTATSGAGFSTTFDPTIPEELLTQSQEGWRGYANRVRDYATNTLKAVPEVAIDQLASGVTSGVKQAAFNAITGGPETPEYNTTYNEIPSFDFGGVDNAYMTQGYSYGGVPSTTIEYYAANNAQYGRFGANAYNTYAPFRNRTA